MNDRKYRRNRQVFITFVVGVTAVIIAVGLVFFVFIGVSKVDGESMVPTLTNNQTLVFYRLYNNYRYGDIIAVDMPSGDYYVKRIIGVPGDKIDIKDGKVFLNDVALNENYIQGVTNTTSEIVEFPLTVPEDKYFVLGDNREHSTDSRAIGCVSKYAILGIILGKN